MGLTWKNREDVERIFEELKNRGETEEKNRDEFVKRTVKKLERKGNGAANKMTRNPGVALRLEAP